MARALARHDREDDAGETERFLRALAWGRLGLVQVLILVASVLPVGLLPRPSTAVLAGVVLVVVATSGTLLLAGPTARPGRVAWLLCLLDVVLATVVVAETGGGRSLFTFLYVLCVTAASVLLPRAGTLLVAATGGLLFTALVVGRTVFPLVAFLATPQPATALEVLTMFVTCGTLLCIAIVAGDVAERFRATRRELAAQRRALRDLEALTNVILHSAGTGLVALDRHHTVTAINRAAEALLGRRHAEVVGRAWSALAPRIVPRVPAAGEGLAAQETELEREDGRRVPVRLTWTSLSAGSDAELGWILVCEDLSEIRAMEARVRQADRLASLGRMAANIAHEIRNPLASLTGAIEVLAREVVPPEQRTRLTEIVLHESDRLNTIIRDFLDYARPAPLVPGDSDVSEMLDEVLVLLGHRDLPPGLKLVRDVPSGLRWQVDAQQFRQALWNLCLNAVEAMPAGGELRLAAAVEGSTLRVSVSDTGEGIPPEDLPHVLEPFFSTKQAGSGLGLALVHRIARDHGAEIEVRSTPGAGTTVTLVLPARHA